MNESQPDEPGAVVTFYSYKGGTGRSMALANIACLLAAHQTAAGGKRVLAIDWDLEAPGLHRYFQPYLRTAPSQPGLIDLFRDVQQNAEKTSLPGDEEERARLLVDRINLPRYVIDTSYPSLSFLQAGLFDDAYSERVNTFSWQSFFHSTPSFHRLFAERLARDYSWVLIDSRTGLTDISGICTMLLPEKLVLVFTPNRQSLTGLIELVRRATKYRRGSDDLRPLVVYPLPSRIETSVQPLAQRWRLGDSSRGVEGWQGQFDAVFREVYDLEPDFTLEPYFDDVQIQHVAPYAYGEPLPVIEERGSDRLTLTKSYETFREYLAHDAPWSEEAAPAAGPKEVRKQIDRLNEAVRAQSARRMWLEWPARHPSMVVAIFTIVGLLALASVLWKQSAARRNVSSRLMASTFRDAQKNSNVVTVLLLEQALDGLGGEDRKLALDELQKRLAHMPEQLKALDVETSPGSSVKFSPDGTRLLLQSADEVTVWNVRTGTRATELKERKFFGAAFFDNAGSFVTVAEDRNAVELRSPDGRVREHYYFPGTFLGLRSDGRYLATKYSIR